MKSKSLIPPLEKSSWSQGQLQDKKKIAGSVQISKKDLFAAKYPVSVVSEKLTQLYEKVRGTGTAMWVQNPEIWTTWMRTEQVADDIRVTVNFITNHPIGQEAQPYHQIFELGTSETFSVPTPTRPIEQSVNIYGEEATFITKYANNFIGVPETSDTLVDVQTTMKNIVLHKWASEKEYLYSDSVYRTTNSNGDLVDTFYNPHHYLDYVPWKDSETPAERFRRELKKRQAPMVIMNHRTKTSARSTGNGANFQNAPPSEIVALHLLRKMLTGDAFKNYLRRGIVSVTGPSGLVYTIVRNSHLIEVYRVGKLLSTLCVYLKDKNMPPTDEVVAKMIIVQCNEHDIWRRANIRWAGVPARFSRTVNRRNFENKHLAELAVA
jgi:hypothetical protein